MVSHFSDIVCNNNVLLLMTMMMTMVILMRVMMVTRDAFESRQGGREEERKGWQGSGDLYSWQVQQWRQKKIKGQSRRNNSHTDNWSRDRDESSP